MGKYFNEFFFQSLHSVQADEVGSTCMACHPPPQRVLLFCRQPWRPLNLTTNLSLIRSKSGSRRECNWEWTFASLPGLGGKTTSSVQKARKSSEAQIPQSYFWTQIWREKPNPGKTLPWFVHCAFLRELQGREGRGFHLVAFHWIAVREKKKSHN